MNALSPEQPLPGVPQGKEIADGSAQAHPAVYSTTEPWTRRVLPVFILVETAEKMSGLPLDMMGVFIRELLRKLNRSYENSTDVRVKAAALTFSNTAQWLDKELVPLEDYQWRFPEGGGICCLGKALDRLNNALSRRAFLTEHCGYMEPVILLFSDGHSADDWYPALERLNENQWFRHAHRFAVPVDSAADLSMLTAFTGSENNVFPAIRSGGFPEFFWDRFDFSLPYVKPPQTGDLPVPSPQSNPLFFLVDSSAGMAGPKLSVVNQAMEALILSLRQDRSEAFWLSALSFSDGAFWLNHGLVSLENFVWTPPEAGGNSDFGAACSQLEDTLSELKHRKQTALSHPVIFLFSNGTPTDNYHPALEHLKQEPLFQQSRKLVIFMGDDADRTIPEQFAGETGNVFTAGADTTPDTLAKWMWSRIDEVCRKTERSTEPDRPVEPAPCFDCIQW